MPISSEEVLFLGSGNTAIAWYRAALPSTTLMCDMIGGVGEPDNYHVMMSFSRTGLEPPQWDRYKLVVLQHVFGAKWINKIKELQSKGVIVLYEIDDYVQGVRKVPGHEAARKYTKRLCVEIELAMRMCDGVIVSTPFLMQRYRKFNKRIWLAKNCIDHMRYAQNMRAARDSIHIGWAGGAGHQTNVAQWLPAVEKLMREDDRVRFGVVGPEIARTLPEDLHPRIFQLPFVSLENFPAVLTNFDICIAPAGRQDFFKAKSDLRWLECAGVGIPVVADPMVYDEIEDGVTGLLAESQEDCYAALHRLVNDQKLRTAVASQARAYVFKHRSIHNGCEQWIRIFSEAQH